MMIVPRHVLDVVVIFYTFWYCTPFSRTLLLIQNKRDFATIHTVLGFESCSFLSSSKRRGTSWHKAQGHCFFHGQAMPGLKDGIGQMSKSNTKCDVQVYFAVLFTLQKRE